MSRYIDIIRTREREVGKLIEFLSRKSNNFTKPKLIMVGGYGLRAFIPFSRTTRDCDFVLKKGNGWHLDQIKRWLPKDISIETEERRDDYGYLRCIKTLKIDKKSAKVSLDFMEGRVLSRPKDRIVIINDKFVESSKKVKILVGRKEQEIYVPSYLDYLILKIVSARPTDVRDVATLVWKNDIPEEIKQRIGEVLPYPYVFQENLRKAIIPVISDKRFLHSWRGTFVTTEFTEETKSEVINELKRLL